MTPFPSPPKGMLIPCRQNPERQFPSENPAQIEAAKTVCRRGDSGCRCPFFDDCLTIALRWNLDGIWAATTPEERQAIRKKTGQVPLPIIVSSYTMRHYRIRSEVVA